MFDNKSFSESAFDNKSILSVFVEIITKFVINLSSKISSVFNLKSGL